MFDKAKLIAHWLEQARYDMDTAKTLFRGGKYPYCLYFCHLSIEKMLKYHIVKKSGEHAPKTHNLIFLADSTGLTFSEKHKELLRELNEFNIEARYPEWKSDFYKRATGEFTEQYMAQTEELFVWLEK